MKVPAAPSSAVSSDQAIIATDISVTRLQRSAIRASGMPLSAYSSANAVPLSRPSCVSLRRRSTFIAWPMIEMIVRSAELKV